MVLEKTLESPLDRKEIKPVNPKGNQPWICIGRIDAKTETPILWPPAAKSQLIGKDPEAGKDWGQEEKGETEDETVGWHHRLNDMYSLWTSGTHTWMEEIWINRTTQYGVRWEILEWKGGECQMSREQKVNPTHLFAGVFWPPVSMFFPKSSATLFTASFFPDGKTLSLRV